VKLAAWGVFSALMLLLPVRAADFAVYDLYIDSQEPLAAYQVKISDRNRSAKILSVEGGEHTAYRQPPHFDPKAIQKNIIKLGAFRADKSENLPIGKTRVASLHVEIFEGRQPDFEVVVEAAARPGGQTIAVQTVILKREEK
jgi:hypothetical protein